MRGSGAWASSGMDADLPPGFSAGRSACQSNRKRVMLSHKSASTTNRHIDTTDLMRSFHGSGSKWGAGRLHFRALAPEQATGVPEADGQPGG